MPENDSDIETSPVDTVTRVLREALGVEDISPDDDFFKLGGHSMQILNVISVLRTEYGLDLPVRQFGKDASIRALAAACRPVRPAADGRAR